MIYFVTNNDGFIKIGYSTNVGRRITNLNISTPHKLNIMHIEKGDESDEKILHEKFKIYRTNGEWFKGCKEIIKYIKDRKKYNIPKKEAIEKIERRPESIYYIEHKRKKIKEKYLSLYDEIHKLQMEKMKLDLDRQKIEWEEDNAEFDELMERRFLLMSTSPIMKDVINYFLNVEGYKNWKEYKWHSKKYKEKYHMEGGKK